MVSYNKHLSSDSNFLLEYMEKMSETDSDLDGYADNLELNSEEEKCTISSFQSYPSHPSGLATSCPPSTCPAPPLSMPTSLRVSSPIMRQLVLWDSLNFCVQSITVMTDFPFTLRICPYLALN